MSNIYCKAGRVELTKEEAERIYTEKRYICTSTAIWQPQYSQAQGRIYLKIILPQKYLIFKNYSSDIFHHTYI